MNEIRTTEGWGGRDRASRPEYVRGKMGEARQAGRDARCELDLLARPTLVGRDVRQRGEEGGAKLAGKDGWAKQDEWCTTGMRDRRCKNGEVGWSGELGATSMTQQEKRGETGAARDKVPQAQTRAC